MAEPIDIPFGSWTRLCPRNRVLDEGHIGATRQIRLNRPRAAAMRPYVGLLGPVVNLCCPLAYEITD